MATTLTSSPLNISHVVAAMRLHRLDEVLSFDVAGASLRSCLRLDGWVIERLAAATSATVKVGGARRFVVEDEAGAVIAETNSSDAALGAALVYLIG